MVYNNKWMVGLVINKLISLILFSQVFALDTAHYVVNLNQTNTYYIWLRVKAAYDQNSIINVSIDNGSQQSITFSNNQNFTWGKVDIDYNLSVGSHDIAINSSVLGTYIDKFVLTSDNNYIPTEEGEMSQTPASIVNVWKVIDLGGKGGTPIIGDLNNDGKPDFIVNGEDNISAYDNSGFLMWQQAISSLNLSYIWWAIYCRPIDINNDGDVDVVGMVVIEDTLYLAALNAMTGQVFAKMEMPELPSGWQFDTTQIANLRGLNSPQDIIIKSTVGQYVPFKLTAYKFEDGNFHQYWEFASNSGETRAGCHRPKVCDIDGDGCDEILFGHWTLEENGTIKWEKPFGYFDDNNHIDSIRPGDIIPSNPGIEIAYSSGNVILDSNGNLIWRKDEYRNFDGQSVALAEMRLDLPGLEVLIAYQEPRNDERLFSSDGTLLYMHDGPSAYMANYETYPIQWIGDEGKESVKQDWGRGRSPSIVDEYDNLVVRLLPEATYGNVGYRPCDVTGDYREELICFNENYIIIYENIAQNSRSFPSPWNNPAYTESHYNWVYY